MRLAGSGSVLWRVRVDLFTEADQNTVAGPCAESLRGLLTDAPGDLPSEAGIDGGLGVEGTPVVGFLFWVRADDAGQAANTAVSVAQEAGSSHGVGPRLYDVVVIPEDAVHWPDGFSERPYPEMPD